MRRLSSRMVTFGGACVHLEYTQGGAAEIADFLFRGVPADLTTPPHVNIRLAELSTDGRFAVYVAGDAFVDDKPAGEAATCLVQAMCRELAGESKAGLVLHSAAAVSNDACVMFPGPTGVGKTTLVGYLSARGFTYLSDELTFIPSRSTSVEALTRPLKIKREALDVLERNVVAGKGLPFLETPTEVLGGGPVEPAAARPRQVPLAAIVFPRREVGREFEIAPITPARAALQLMACVLNARNLPAHGFDEVIRVARAVPSYQMRYHSLDQLEANLDALRAGSLCRGSE